MGKTRRQDTAETTLKETIRELKSINRGQQKEIARLRKELDRRQDLSDDYQELLSETDGQKQAIRNAPQNCPKCSADVQASPIGKFLLVTCKECDWRQRKHA